MSESSGSLHVCPLCKVEMNKEDITVHFLEFLEYKKFVCGDCSLDFFTEEDMEQHCRTEKHSSASEIRLHPWKETMLALFVQDAKYLGIYDEATFFRIREQAMEEWDKIRDTENEVSKKKKSTGCKTITRLFEEASSSHQTKPAMSEKAGTSTSTRSPSTERKTVVSTGSVEVSDPSSPVVHRCRGSKRDSSAATDSSIDTAAAKNRNGDDLRSPRVSPRRVNCDSQPDNTIVVSGTINAHPEIPRPKCKKCKKKIIPKDDCVFVKFTIRPL